MATVNAPDELAPRRTRTASLLGFAIAALVVVVLALVFVVQNDRSQRLEFLWFDFTLPIGVTVLLAASIGGLLVGGVAVARTAQLRMGARRHRKTEHQPPAGPDDSA